MKRRTIIILAVVFSVIISGLILVQIYWINNAIEAKNQQFRVLINSALDAVVSDLERQETIDRIFEEINLPSFDSVVAIVPSNSPLARQLQVNTPGIRGNDVYGDIPGMENPVMINREGQKLFLYSDENYLFPGDQETEISSHSIRAGISDRLTKKTIQLENIMGRLLSVTPELDQRIEKEQFESLLGNTLGRLGIELGYEYGISDGDELVYSSDGYSDRSSSRKYLRQLFPNDPVPGQYKITLYFPKETNYFFMQVGFIGFSSILITLVLIFFSAANIIIILRQKRLSEIRNDFINNMTHELKTPISTIFLASQMMSDKSISQNQKNLDNLSKILNDESLRLKYQVEKVLQASVFDRGSMELKFVSTDIHIILSNIIDNFSLQISDTKGTISKDFQSGTSNLVVDEVHFANMISNLIDNAIKYSNGQPEIVVSTRETHHKVIILVSDRGIGIKREDLKESLRSSTGSRPAIYIM
ncbi:MAG: HAMP domain-containing sensor histidine kinase [Bacteroidales bacterium]